MLNKVFFTVALFAVSVGLSEAAVADTSSTDTLQSHNLLQDIYIQLEATDAINDLYNFKFERSASQINYLKKKYGWHPMPYFLMGLNYYWRMIPYLKSAEYDEEFLAYMDSSLYLAERL